MLSREQFAEVDRLFNEALDKPPATRAQWLDEVCGNENSIRTRVEELLELVGSNDDALGVEGGIVGPMWAELAAELELESRGGEALEVGVEIRNYRITGFLGKGGMGFVYRAEDTNLEREVALKALSPAFTADPSNLRRFQREAKLLASLNHPNIAAIYDVIEHEEQPYLVLEYVDGDTLDRRLAISRFSLVEALNVGHQLTEALEEAHRKGVIHRDLKPSNLKLTPTGRVKVLDFGLAKASPPIYPRREATAPEADKTLPGAQTTHAGVVLGTPGYMSPEQARGQQVDKRSDIWAFGCLLYEMVTGERAFGGESPSESIAAILRDPVDWDRIPEETPLPLRRLIRRCLEKDPAQRIQDIGDARIELGELLAATATGIDSYPDWQPIATPAGKKRRRYLGASLLLGVGAIVGLWIASALIPNRSAERIIRSTIRVGPGLRLFDGASKTVAISPDGSRLAWIGSDTGGVSLYVRELQAFEAVKIRNSDNARNPFFSPDGNWIGFFAEGELRRAAVSGGLVETMATDIGLQLRGASWSGAGILFAQDSGPGIYHLPLQDGEGAEPVVVSTPSDAGPARVHLWPQWLGDGRHAVITVRDQSESGVPDELAVLNIADGTVRGLRSGAQAEVVPGHLLFISNGALEAVRFNSRRRTILGASLPVLDRVHSYPGGAASYAVSENGTLLYLPRRETISLAWLDEFARLSRVPLPEGTPGWPRLSPDGTQAAIHLVTPDSRNIWLLDLTRPGSSRQLTSEGGGFPVWSPDGNRIAFMSRRSGRGHIYTVATNGSEQPARLVGGDRTKIPTSWSSQGYLAFYEIAESTQRDIWTVHVDSAETAPFLMTEANELAPTFSPDGRYIAYVSNQSGQNEIYVRGFPPPGAVVAVSIDGGTEPEWNRDGSVLYYRRGDTLMSVAMRTGEEDSVAPPRPVLDTEFVPNSSGNPTFSAMPAGERFLVLRRSGEFEDQLRLVQSWFVELEGLTTSRE